MSRLVVAAIQMQSGPDKAQNLATAERLVDEAVGTGAMVVALPEHFDCGGIARLQWENAEPIPGPSVDRLRRKASTAAVYLVAGSLAERVAGTDKAFNTSVLIDPSGGIAATYRKTHMFDVEVCGQLANRESEFFQPGSSIVSAETDYGVVGLTICYDLRFPEIYRELALRGAGIIFVVSSFMHVTGKDHWQPLLRARAIENQVFIVAPNQSGSIPGSNALRYGHSAIIDPWGIVLAEASDGECVITAELDFDGLNRIRRQLPSLRARRADLYGGFPDSQG